MGKKICESIHNAKLSERLRALLKGGIHKIFIGTVLIRAVSMISSIVIVRLVNKEDYAYLSYAYNLYSYLTLFEGLGLSSALLKYCSSEENPGKDKAYLIFALKWGCLFQLAVAVALNIGAHLAGIPFPQAYKYMHWMILLPTLEYSIVVFQCYNRAHLENDRYVRIGVVQAVVLCALSIAFVLVFNLEGALIARYVAIAVALAMCVTFVVKKLKPVVINALNQSEKRGIMSMGISLTLANLFSGMMPINEAFLVNNIIKDEITTANFRVAGLFPQQLLLVTSAVVIYFFPIVAKIKDPKEAWHKGRSIGIFNAVLVIVAAGIGALVTPLLIRILYGKGYIDAVPVSYLLWIMLACNAAIRVVPMNLLPAIGKTKFPAACNGVSCVLHVIIDYFMIINYGMLGVAYASIIIYVLSGTALWAYYYRCCKKEMFE